MDQDELALSIVEAVAEREGVAVTELEESLHEAVNTDALASLFETTVPEETNPSVTFTYCGYTVRVDGSGEIELSESLVDAAPPKASV